MWRKCILMCVLVGSLGVSGCATLDRLAEWRVKLEDKIPGKKPAEATFPDGTAWLHQDVSGWPATTPLTVSLHGGHIHLVSEQKWPGVSEIGTTMAANVWVVVERGETWYAATCDWLRPNQYVKNREIISGDHTKKSELSGWSPRSGETVGIFISGLVRGSARNVSERSELVWFVWP